MHSTDVEILDVAFLYFLQEDRLVVANSNNKQPFPNARFRGLEMKEIWWLFPHITNGTVFMYLGIKITTAFIPAVAFE
jgi:hypothetical protein